MAQKKSTINVRGSEVSIYTENDLDFISLTDMVNSFEGGSALIEQWLKNKDTVLFLRGWKQFNDVGFNSLEFEGIKIVQFVDDGSVWLSQKQMAELFGTSKQNISLHANNVQQDKELYDNSVVKECLITASDEVKIDLRFEGDTFWLSQKKMAELFDVDVRTINEHLKNIFDSGKLEKEATIRKFRIVQKKGNREVARETDGYIKELNL